MADSKPVIKNFKDPGKTFGCIDKLGGIYCNICNYLLMKKWNFDRHYRDKHGDDIVYTCAKCRTSITPYAAFRAHCYKHFTKDKFQCHICLKSFSKTQALVDHLRNIHEMGQYLCPTPCNQIFNSLSEFKQHTASHKFSSPNCVFCSTELPDEAACSTHLKSHVEHHYVCPICPEEFANIMDAPEHLQLHYPDEVININELAEYEITYRNDDPQISCGICKESYKTKVDFDTHYFTQHDVNIVYSCALCWKSFTAYNLFSNHCYNHVVKGAYKCDDCKKTFNRLALLVLHMETIHVSTSDQEKPYSCIECGQQFCNGRTLKSHLLEQHNVAYQICPFPACGKMFDSPPALLLHQIDHRPSQQLRCKTCGLTFKNLAACFKHIHLHKKTKINCPICQRKYSEKRLVLTHIRQHYQPDMHICFECGKAYNLKSRLLEHKKIHTKSIHACSYCDKKFPTKIRLHDHLNTHTKQTPYKCWVCEKRFPSASGWRKHLKNIHEITSVKISMLEKLNNNDANNVNETETDDLCEESFNILDIQEPISEQSELNTITEAIATDVAGNLNGQLLDLDASSQDIIAACSQVLPENVPEIVSTNYTQDYNHPVYLNQTQYPYMEPDLTKTDGLQNITFNDGDFNQYLEYDMIIANQFLTNCN